MARKGEDLGRRGGGESRKTMCEPSEVVSGTEVVSEELKDWRIPGVGVKEDREKRSLGASSFD